jgi:hypothetical protein
MLMATLKVYEQIIQSPRKWSSIINPNISYDHSTQKQVYFCQISKNCR